VRFPRKLIVDAGGAHRAREQVRPPPIRGAAHDAGERHFTFRDLDVDDRSPASGRDRERPVFFDPFEDEMLEFVVVQHPGLGPSNRFCSHSVHP
jgi:hypothetical protein